MVDATTDTRHTMGKVATITLHFTMFLFVEVSCLVLVAPGVVFMRAGVADGATRPDQAQLHS